MNTTSFASLDDSSMGETAEVYPTEANLGRMALQALGEPEANERDEFPVWTVAEWRSIVRHTLAMARIGA